LDQDADVGSGELIGIVRLSRAEIQKALADGSPLLTKADSQVDKLELEISRYEAAPSTNVITFDVRQNPLATSLRVRAGELVTIRARGNYSVADNHQWIDERGYGDTEKRDYNRKPDFDQINHGMAIAYIGAPTDTHSALAVGSCIAAISPTSGQLYVGVNDRDVGNNQGSLEFTPRVALPSVEQWRSGGLVACPAAPNSLLADITRFKEKMCACRTGDKDCAQNVLKEMQEYAARKKDLKSQKFTDEERKEAAQLGATMAQCSKAAMGTTK
jgi:hypothetical protein